MSSRVIPPGHRSITGAMPSRHSAKPLQYESKLERDFLILMEIEWWLTSIVTQPATIELEVDGQLRRYTPDVLVAWHPDCAYVKGLGSISPALQTSEQHWQTKSRTVRHWRKRMNR